jgi:RimJ/RimL family protein N-acetyltransferase
MESQIADPTIKMFGVYNLDPVSACIGVCGFTSIDRVNQKAEFSLYIAPQFHGCGYGSAALYTLVRHGFEDMNLNRIWGETFDGNPAESIFKRIGFKKEGTLKQSYFRKGRFIDSHIYGIIRGELK